MYCRECGKEIADNARFCQHCGTAQDEELQNKLFFYLKKSVGEVQVLPGRDESARISFEIDFHKRYDYSPSLLERLNNTFIGGSEGEFVLKISGFPESNGIIILNNWTFDSSLRGTYNIHPYNSDQNFRTMLPAKDIYQNVISFEFSANGASSISRMLKELIESMLVLSMFEERGICKKSGGGNLVRSLSHFGLFESLSIDEMLNVSNYVKKSDLYKTYDEFNYLVETFQWRLNNMYKYLQSNSN